jgi:O-methyltransferase involved in polyketide biosynthesis
MPASSGPPSHESIVLGSAQETMLIPLLGRALESDRPSGLLRDRKAQAIVASMNYDFSKWRHAPSLTACTIRTLMFDQEVQRFLDEHPDGTVVELGCGMNTRCERLSERPQNARAHWIEVDLPEAIAWRRQFFDDTPNRRMVAVDLSRPDWYGELDLAEGNEGPICFVAEASVIYLPERAALAMLRRLARRFPQAVLVMDSVAPWVVATQGWHDAMRHLSPGCWFRWGCADPAALAEHGLRLQHSRTLDACGADVLRRAPWPWPLMLGAMSWSGRWWLDAYRINRFELEHA